MKDHRERIHSIKMWVMYSLLDRVSETITIYEKVHEKQMETDSLYRHLSLHINYKIKHRHFTSPKSEDFQVDL